MRGPGPVFLLIALLAGCATAPEPNERPRPTKKTPTPTPVPADVGAPDQNPTRDSSTEARAQPAATAPPPPRVETWGGMGLKEVNEKEWLAGVRNKVAERLKVEPAQLVFSPGKLRVAVVRGPAEAIPPKRPAQRPRPRRFQIVVVDNQGVRQVIFRPITAKGSDEPPKDLRFLSEDRLVYEVAAPPAPEPPAAKIAVAAKTTTTTTTKTARRSAPAKPRSVGRGAGRTPRKNGRKPAGAPTAPPPASPSSDKPAAPPTRLFIIQPLEPRARPIRCEGRSFVFTAAGDHLAFVGGTPEAGYVAVDGTPIYPRKGRAVVSSPVAWSKDGHSLAFLESPADGPAHLVLLAEYDNPTGDTTWNLPPAVSIDGARVFWAGSGRLVVGKTVTHPIFSASFQKLR